MSDFPILGTDTISVPFSTSPYYIPSYSIDELVLLVSAGAADMMVMWPPAVGSNKKITIIKYDPGLFEIDSTLFEGDTFNGDPSVPSIDGQWSAIRVIDAAVGQWITR